MKIFAKVKPNAKEDRVEKLSDNEFLILVKARPQEGRANQAAKEILSEYFGVPKSCVNLLKGKTSRQKVFEIE